MYTPEEHDGPEIIHDTLQADELDLVYSQRNTAVFLCLALAKKCGMNVGIARDFNASEDWPVVYIDLPHGQVSWHVKRDEANVFAIPEYRRRWDGHNAEKKNARIDGFISQQLRGSHTYADMEEERAAEQSMFSTTKISDETTLKEFPMSDSVDEMGKKPENIQCGDDLYIRKPKPITFWGGVIAVIKNGLEDGAGMTQKQGPHAPIKTIKKF